MASKKRSGKMARVGGQDYTGMDEAQVLKARTDRIKSLFSKLNGAISSPKQDEKERAGMRPLDAGATQPPTPSRSAIPPLPAVGVPLGGLADPAMLVEAAHNQPPHFSQEDMRALTPFAGSGPEDTYVGPGDHFPESTPFPNFPPMDYGNTGDPTRMRPKGTKAYLEALASMMDY